MANNTIISFITRAFLPSLSFSLSFFLFQFQFSIYVYIHRSKRGGSFSKGEILTSIELDEIFRLFNFSIARGHRDRSLAPGRETLNVTRRDWRFSRFGNFSLSSRFLKQPSCPLSSVPLSRIADGSRQSQSARVRNPNGWIHRPSIRNVARVALLCLLRSNHTPARPRSEEEFLKKRKRKLLEKEYIFPGIFNQFIVFIGIAEQTQIQYPEHNNIVLIYPAGHSSGERRKAGRETRRNRGDSVAAGKKSPLFAPFCLHVD